MDGLKQAGLAIFGAIIGLAILSVIVSRKSQTTSVISAFSNALSSTVSAAVSPISSTYGSGNNATNSFSAPNLTGLVANLNLSNPSPSWIIGN